MPQPIDVTTWEHWWAGTVLGQPEIAGRLLRQWPPERCQDGLVRDVLTTVQRYETAGEPWQMSRIVLEFAAQAADLMAWMLEATRMAPVPAQLVADLQAAWVADQTATIMRSGQRRVSQDGAEAAMQWVEDELARVRGVAQSSTRTLTQVEAMLSFLAWAEKRQDPNATPIRETPWPLLNAIGGGLAPEELIVVAARPGDGKTSMALQVATEVAKAGTPVLYLSYEMSSDRLLAQMAAQQYGVDRYRLSQGRLDDAGWSTVTYAVGGMTDWPLWWWRNREGPDFAAIAAEVERLMDHGLGLVVVDYLELVPRKHERNTPEELQDLTYALKGLTWRHQIPIVLCQQLKREAADPNRAPRLADLAWSGGIEKAADKVWMLQKIDQGTKRRVWIRKHRDGPLGLIDLDWDGPRSRMTESAHQPRPEEVAD